MPHPDAEHSLRIQLATALRERDESREQTEKWLRVVEKLRENLNVTLLERDALRAEVKRLREALQAVTEECTKKGNPGRCDVAEHQIARAALAGGVDRG